MNDAQQVEMHAYLQAHAGADAGNIDDLSRRLAVRIRTGLIPPPPGVFHSLLGGDHSENKQVIKELLLDFQGFTA